jgi:hypothetical protein
MARGFAIMPSHCRSARVAVQLYTFKDDPSGRIEGALAYGQGDVFVVRLTRRHRLAKQLLRICYLRGTA